MNSFRYWRANQNRKKTCTYFTISLIHLRQTYKPCVYAYFMSSQKKKHQKQIACKQRLNGLFHSMFVFANFCDQTNLKYKTKYYHIDAPEKINK